MTGKTLAIIFDLEDELAFNGFTFATRAEVVEIIEDDSITDKTTSIASTLGAINDNIEKIRKVLLTYNLE